MYADSTQSTGFCVNFSKRKPEQNLGGKAELSNWVRMQDLY